MALSIAGVGNINEISRVSFERAAKATFIHNASQDYNEDSGNGYHDSGFEDDEEYDEDYEDLLY